MNNEKDIFDFIKPKKVDVPSDDFFANLSQEIIEKEKTPIVPMYKKPLGWIAGIVASMAIVLAVGFLGNNTPPKSALAQLDEVELEDVETYVEENFDSYELDEIIAEIPDSDIDEIPEPVFVEEKITWDDISQEDILDYIDSELDIDELDEELFI